MIPYTVATPLVVPSEVFDPSGLATLAIQGSLEQGSQGSLEWELKVTLSLDDHAPLGGIVVASEAAFLPGSALEATRNWLLEECQCLGLELMHFLPVTDRVQPDHESWVTYATFCIRRP